MQFQVHDIFEATRLSHELFKSGMVSTVSTTPRQVVIHRTGTGDPTMIRSIAQSMMRDLGIAEPRRRTKSSSVHPIVAAEPSRELARGPGHLSLLTKETLVRSDRMIEQSRELLRSVGTKR